VGSKWGDEAHVFKSGAVGSVLLEGQPGNSRSLAWTRAWSSASLRVLANSSKGMGILSTFVITIIWLVMMV